MEPFLSELSGKFFPLHYLRHVSEIVLVNEYRHITQRHRADAVLRTRSSPGFGRQGLKAL
jgi:hypothetical protein